MATSNITGTTEDPSGDPVGNVTLIFRLKPRGFRIDDGVEIAPVVEVESDANGLFTIALERQANITPENTVYEVEEQIPDANGGPAFHTIQVGAANATLKASRVELTPPPGDDTYLTQEAGDARYQVLGSLGSTTPQVRSTANATAGVSTSARRDDAVPSLHSEVAGDGLSISGGILAVSTDGATIEISSDALRQKDDGTTLAKLSTQARGGFLHRALYDAGVI